ncbi:epidermal growth factor receptor substrate 15 homolog isoform X2 [Bactrocera oleae]|uniref:epidermal growth factor receptor substrate 15 homolog isoform X2 n=1 Tax=Bactrocera oleae TaxID=104688 RepID=UPI00387E994E
MRMEGTPRLKKRGSLTLGRHHKRDTSPNILQGKMRSSTIMSIDNNNDSDEYKLLRTPKTPSIASLSSDGGIECTPPHKKFNLDDSVEYSPKCFDNSFSPGSLLSQTLSSNSPEVGWKWGRRSTDDPAETATPDSAYAADSSFTSAGSSSREVISRIGRFRSDSNAQRLAYEVRKEEQRRKLEIQMRRAEKLRADELLKQRCAKLQEQLREAEKRRKQEMEKKLEIREQLQREKENRNFLKATAESESIVELAEINDIFTNANDTLDDFFNDSDSDDLLLEATQQVESKIVELTQKPEIKTTTTTTTLVANDSIQTNNTALNRKNTSTIPNREEKRSSLYMKFLEDDTPDDWLFSLDDEIMQATQQPKSRISLQRHNSMPTNTSMTSATGSAGASKRISTITSSALQTSSSAASSKAVYSPKIKRHSSSTTLRSSTSAASGCLIYITCEVNAS